MRLSATRTQFNVTRRHIDGWGAAHHRASHLSTSQSQLPNRLASRDYAWIWLATHCSEAGRTPELLLSWLLDCLLGRDLGIASKSLVCLLLICQQHVNGL